MLSLERSHTSTTGRLGPSVQSGVFCPFEKRTCQESEAFFPQTPKRHMTRHELNQRHKSLVFYEYITYGSGIFHSLPCQVRRTWMKHCVVTTRSMIAVLLTSTLLAVTQPCFQLAHHRCESKLKLRHGQMVARHMFLEVAVDCMTDEIYSIYIYVQYLFMYIYISFSNPYVLFISLRLMPPAFAGLEIAIIFKSICLIYPLIILSLYVYYINVLLVSSL